MRHSLFVLALAFIGVEPASSFEPARDPNLAAVRVKSHGASATVIATTPGKSWLLGCAHMFFDEHDQVDPALAARPIRLDGPVQPYAPRKAASARLVAVDAAADLSLLVLDNGPFHFVPVAPRGHPPSRNLRSVGYDGMAWPVTNRPATVVGVSGDWTFTREKPWHGRSGGGLIDLEARVLIGVVNGYETTGQQRGVYTSHDAVLRFLEQHFSKMPRQPHTPPAPDNRQRYASPFQWHPLYQLECPT